MKRIISVLLISMLLLSLPGCSNSSTPVVSASTPLDSQSVPSSSSSTLVDDPTIDNSTLVSSSTADSSTQNSDDFAELLDDILVEMEIDHTLSQAIVTISNASSMTFDGNISVSFKNFSNNYVGTDMIFVEDLTAGNWTYARINISETENIEMTYNIVTYQFTEGAAVDGGTLDEEASVALATAFENGFGGAGNPEWATRWYKYATKIEVFSAESNKYAVITVDPTADSDAIESIGNAIFGNYSKDYELARVILVDPDGNTVFDRSV